MMLYVSNPMPERLRWMANVRSNSPQNRWWKSGSAPMALLSLISLLHWKGQHLQVTCIVSRLTNVWWISLAGISTVRRFAAMVTKQSSGVSTQTLDKSQLLRMYEQMETIREFEERARTEFASGKIPGFVHLYAGEEAVAVCVCPHLTDDDYITNHHRPHRHRIPNSLTFLQILAEFLTRH